MSGPKEMGVREMPEFARVPFVFLSYQPDIYFVDKAQGSEADTYASHLPFKSF